MEMTRCDVEEDAAADGEGSRGRRAVDAPAISNPAFGVGRLPDVPARPARDVVRLEHELLGETPGGAVGGRQRRRS
jgi:hypothetical protein